MGLQSFGLFIGLINKGHQVTQMGFHGSPGDVRRLWARMSAAMAFRGIELEGINRDTVRGYEALFQILLTHSALEQYLRLTVQKLDDIEGIHKAFGSEQTIKEFFVLDP